MPNRKVYKTPPALRTALEARLLDLAKLTGTDIQRLRRRVGFDRFLARLFAQARDQYPWFLKGGYAMEIRMHVARTTKDIDLSIASQSPIGADVLHRMIDEAASFELPDGFTFQVGESILDLDAAPQGGCRFPVQATMAGRPFVGFQVDIAVGDELIEPTDQVEGEGWFDFAGLPRPTFRMISCEQQFAEKIHAYTLQKRDRDIHALKIWWISCSWCRPKCNLSACARTSTKRLLAAARILSQ